MIFTREETEQLLYDADAFFYFAGAMLTVLLVPWTTYLGFVILLPKTAEEADFDATSKRKPGQAVRLCNTAFMEDKRRKASQVARSWRVRLSGGIGVQLAVVITLWICLTGVVWRLKDTPPELRGFDPYAILGVAPASDLKTIKKAYRKKSLLHHPDKDNQNPMAHVMFHEVVKAYAALTDEKGRKNYEIYGNPDGPVRAKVSVALHPDLLVSKENQLMTLCAFFAILFVVPFSILCCCLRGSQLSTNGVSAETMRVLEACIDSEVRAKDGPELVAASAEARVIGGHSFQNVVQAMTDKYPRPLCPGCRVLVNGPACAAAGPKGSASQQDKKDRLGVIRSFDEAKGTCEVEVDKEDVRVVPKQMVKVLEPRIHCTLTDRMIRRNACLLWAHLWRLHEHMGPEVQAELDKLLQISSRIGRPMVSLAGRAQRDGAGPLHAAKGMIHFRRCLVQALDLDASPLLQIPHVKKVTSRAPTLQQVVRGEAKPWIDSLKLSDQQRLDVNSFCKHMPIVHLQCTVEVEDEEGISETDLATLQVTLVRDNLEPGESVGPVHAPLFPVPQFEEWWLLVWDDRSRYMVAVTAILGTSKEETAKIFFPVQRKGEFRWTVHAMCSSYVGLDVDCQVKFQALPKNGVNREIFIHPEDMRIKTCFEWLMEGLQQELEDDSDSDDDTQKGIQNGALPAPQCKPALTQAKPAAVATPNGGGKPDGDDDTSDSDTDIIEGNFYRIAKPEGVPLFNRPKEDDDLKVGTIPQGTIVRGYSDESAAGWLRLIPGQGAWIRGDPQKALESSTKSSEASKSASSSPIEAMGGFYEQKLSVLLSTPTPLLLVQRWTRRSKVELSDEDVLKIRELEDPGMRMFVEEMLRKRMGDDAFEHLLDKAEELAEQQRKRIAKAIGFFTSPNGVVWHVSPRGAVRGVALDGSKIRDKAELSEENEIRLGIFRLDETRTCSCIHWIRKDDPQKVWNWSRDDSLRARLRLASVR